MHRIATIGFFDGVHTGHLFLLHTLRDLGISRGEESMVITFCQHPRAVLRQPQLVVPQLLTTPEERIALLRQQGIQHIEMMDFSAIQHFTARAFMQYLYDTFDVRTLLLGYDHRFGSDGVCTAADYQQIGESIGIEVVRVPEFTSVEQHISSTEIRKSLLAGEIDKANLLLGYPYCLQGRVVSGKQLGREIGFPTANIALTAEKLIPKSGVWVVNVRGVNDVVNTPLEQSQPMAGLLNIGTNPTVGGTKTTIEVHILNFQGNLYDKFLTLELLCYLREERKFDSLSDLQEQIEQDICKANAFFDC